MAETLFWASLIFVWYAYFGYPAALALLALFRNRPVRKSAMTPTVSLIVTAYNEREKIGQKIDNALQLKYPRDRIEIIVASDCSTDGTDGIVASYAAAGVKLVRAPERKGKENAQKHAIAAASGEILVFSDVATILPPTAIENIVMNFNDKTVGCVSSVDRFVDREGNLSGEGAYVRYEMLLRDLETRVNSLVGLSGSFFAARREVCRNWAADLQSDFNTLLNSVKLGLRGVSDRESVGYYLNLADERKEFQRKVRTVVRGISVFMRSLPLLNPLRHGLFSWQLVSHKLCRWLVPFALLLLLASNVLLVFAPRATNPVYALFLLLQFLFYGAAILGRMSRALQAKAFVRIPAFFVTVNLSILLAWLKYLRGTRAVSWEPSRR